MGFNYKKSLRSVGSPVLIRVILDNSEVATLGDCFKVYNAGHAEVASAGRPVAGIVHAVVSKLGLRPDPDTAGGETWTVESDNETDKQVAVLLDIDPMSVYSVAPDATLGTTNDSELPGCSMDVVSASQLDESTALRNASGQFYCHGADPEDTTRVLCSIMESELRAGGTYS